ncbi:PREDICTED: uncharacterized protein LOC106744405 [Dinoponera quadriceps]|uniref:Uncharacterized protein LOC106744405 n=1 Tax=Dinoponera quadriceps TaxID=609295 RepID=A0A6P3X8R5_DINQU|nr:PREDICTED: uncharacterized protein LOC106744405 [Dinoponera quadriceps]
MVLNGSQWRTIDAPVSMRQRNLACYIGQRRPGVALCARRSGSCESIDEKFAANMEVTGTSRVADTRLSTADSSAGDANSGLNNDFPGSEELSRADDVTAGNEEVTDALATNHDSAPDNATREKRSKCADSSHSPQQTSEDHKTESSEGTTERVISPHASQTSLAFTIDFGNSKEVDTAKYQNLFERYNARHRRNLSTSKVEVKSKKPSNLLSPNLVQKQKVPSTHSEGYFSSEDDTKRKIDQLSERLKQLGVKVPSKAHSSTKKSTSEDLDTYHQNKQCLMTRSCDDELRHNKSFHQGLPLELEHSIEANENVYWTSPKSSTINDLSRVQINNYDDDENEKLYTKNIEYIDVDHECKEVNDFEDVSFAVTNKVSNMNYITDDLNIKNTSGRENSLSSVSYAMDLKVGEADLDVFNVSNVDAGSDGAVSEAGTYTIHKDYTDEEKARMDIDKVFSVGVLTEDESNEAYVHNFKMSISRDNNAWISEWATQVAEHNSLPPIIGGSTGRTPPLSPTKIPSPIHSRSQRMSRNRYEQSDSNPDTDTYVRIKERIGMVSSQQQIIDSGGESDDDTSNSYNTPPNSSQRTPVHSTAARRSSLSESLFRRANTNENRRSVRKYLSSARSKTADTNVELLNSPSQVLSPLHLERRSSSLDRKEYASDTTESNTSRRNSMKYKEEDLKHTNSPILSRLRPPTPKLTNSPIVSRKAAATKVLDSPMLERSKHMTKSPQQAKNIGYFTCVENSPYMLRKSNSTTNYHEGSSYFDKDASIKAPNVLRNSPEFHLHLNIQRSSSNASIRNMKSQNMVSRRSSFNSSDVDRISSRGKFLVASDSSSEAGEQQRKSPLTPISSGIKLNRAFSIRRARLNCESDTTPNTTPEERRRRAQSEVKTSAPMNKQQSYHRSRTSSVGAHSKELKKSEPTKYRTPSISRTDTGRFSMRASKPTHHPPSSQKTNQKPSKDHKKSGRSNSTLTSKEVEFQNWKRRKSYDPMKAAAEGRKKLIDSTKKHHSTEDGSGNHDNSVLRSASFHGTGGALSLANDWSDNEFHDSYHNNQVPPPSSPQLESDSDLETSSYLQTTQNVVSAMSARMTSYRPPLDSDNESDEDTSHSLHQNIPKGLRHPSDTESSDERHPMAQSPISNTKYNRELSLRRVKLDPQRTKPVSSTANKAKNFLHDARGKPESISGIGRTDSGRPSARVSRTSSMGPKNKPKESKKPPTPNVREVEMQNWKRRKSYDPMKAAMEGRRKAGLAKKNINENLSPSHVARSQSFHGSVGLVVSDWSDEEPVISADEAPLY